MQGKSSLNNTYRPASGMGCHPCREVALLRALSEAAQSRLTFISGARDDMPREEYIEFLDPQTHETWSAGMERATTVRDFSHIPTWRGKTFEDDVNWELERLVTVGVEEVVAVDLTKPEFEIPVVRVIIPGLEGLNHSPKYVFGRRARAQLKNAA